MNRRRLAAARRHAEARTRTLRETHHDAWQQLERIHQELLREARHQLSSRNLEVLTRE
jgi:hypothetical protein